MKKLSLMLALVAAAMLPITAVAQDTTKSKSSKRKHGSSKSKSESSKSPNAKDSASDNAGKSGDSNASNAAVETAPRTIGSGQKKVTLSDEQILLSERALEAAKNGNFKDAELYYTASLKIQENNAVLFNLAYAQLKQDKCISAKDSLDRIANAPILDDENAPPEAINAAAEKTRAELNTKCSATFKLNCSPAEMVVTIDNDSNVKCDGTEYAVVPGKHSFKGETDKGFNSVVVDTPANMLTIAPIEVIDYEAIVDKAGITPEELKKRSTLFKALGYTFIGVGVAAAGTGAFLDWYYWNNYKKDYDKFDTDTGSARVDTARHDSDQNVIYVGYALIGVGAAMAVTGIVLVVYDAVSIQPQYEELTRGRTAFMPTFAPVVSPDFTGFTLSTSF